MSNEKMQKEKEVDVQNKIMSNGMTFQDVKKIIEENEKVGKDFESKGASLEGDSPIDKKYKEHMEQAIEFMLQFTKEENLMLMEASIMENPAEWGM